MRRRRCVTQFEIHITHSECHIVVVGCRRRRLRGRGRM